MTRPKFRPCPSCQAPNQANKKHCSVCYGSLSMQKKLKEKAASLDSQWGDGVIKNRNVGRIMNSACIAVRKLEAVGYKPILFIGKQHKASNKWVADIVTHFPPTIFNILEKMKTVYEFLLTNEEQPNTDTPPSAEVLDNPTVEQGISPAVEQGVSPAVEQGVNLAGDQAVNPAVEQGVNLAGDQAVSPAVEQGVSSAVEQGVSPTVEQGVNLAGDQAVNPAVEQGVNLAGDQAVSPAVEQGVSSAVKQGVNLAGDQAVSPAVEQGVSAAVEQGVSPDVEQGVETEFVLNLFPCPLSPQSSSMSLSSSTTVKAKKKRKRGTDSQPLTKEGNKKKKGCRKCSRQKIFHFQSIAGRRVQMLQPWERRIESMLVALLYVWQNLG